MAEPRERKTGSEKEVHCLALGSDYENSAPVFKLLGHNLIRKHTQTRVAVLYSRGALIHKSPHMGHYVERDTIHSILQFINLCLFHQNRNYHFSSARCCWHFVFKCGKND